ncbi:urease accessory protein UreD [Pseudoprimorskyibacter insulae]|uniref:Urease accessory protein UreD n=1 Tax=Pseudoprimorskyibacter insulae TaxID=1695997 RepID=A0A2R8AZW7_9RHOB|nr:urease accessory protein UreD [Pseudoprimorskyibacter insulae]SPF81570.1 Urease accessory protein UreD [Pseudoprimorskyibacter insulae]
MISAADTAKAQRARGALRLSARRRGPLSEIGELYQAGSMRLLFPQRRGPALSAVMLNTAGGVTGGDQFALDLEAEAGSHLTISTQAAERIYRAQPGPSGQVTNRLVLRDNTRVDWLPQETILFDQASLSRRLEIDMTASSRLLACEALVFGRRAMGETVDQLHLTDRIDLRIDGRLAFADRLRLTSNAEAQLARIGVAGGAVAMATILFAASGAAGHVPALRDMLPNTGGVSALSGDLIVLRVLGADSYALRQSVLPVLAHLNQAALPRTWMI